MAQSTGFLGKQHAAKTREKIKVTQIVNRLNKIALGEVEADAQQMRAAEILLRKALPDLSAVHTTDDQSKSLEDWLDEADRNVKPTEG